MEYNNNKTPRTIGITMLIIGWLLILALIWILYTRVIFAPQQTKIEYLDGITKITLFPKQDGHYWIDGIISSQYTNNDTDTKIEFLIDTGASTVAIPEKLATKLKLPKLSSATVLTASGEITAYNTKIDKLIMAGVVMHDVRAVILPSFSGDQALLGMNVLKKFQIEQSSTNFVLTIHQQKLE